MDIVNVFQADIYAAEVVNFDKVFERLLKVFLCIFDIFIYLRHLLFLKIKTPHKVEWQA